MNNLFSIDEAEHVNILHVPSSCIHKEGVMIFAWQLSSDYRYATLWEPHSLLLFFVLQLQLCMLMRAPGRQAQA
jgi:hypothetical protein